MPSHDNRSTVPTPRPLDGVVVVALEQAVAAPYCSSRLADAGARVIKIERREGDFARGYDHSVHGELSEEVVFMHRQRRRHQSMFARGLAARRSTPVSSQWLFPERLPRRQEHG